MRSMRARVRVVAAAVLAGFVFLPVAPAHAASASPATVHVNCGAGFTSATITGQVGDLVTIFNDAGGANTCDLVPGAAYLDGSTGIVAGGSQVYSITAAGSFYVVGFQGNAAEISVVVASPSEHVPGVGEPRAIDLPGNPSSVSATSIATGIRVDWTAPTWSGADTIIRYAVFVTGQTSPDAVCDVPAGTLKCNVWSLEYDKDYTFYVKAQSPIGWSTASPSSNPASMGRVIPGTPTIVEFSRAVKGSVKAVATVLSASGDAAYEHFDYQIAPCAKPCTGANESLSWSATKEDTTPLFVTLPDAQVAWAIRVRQVSDTGDASAWVYKTEEAPSLKAPTVDMAMLDADSQHIRLRWIPDATSAWWTSKYRISYQTSNKPWVTSSTSDWKPLISVWNTNARFVLDPEYLVRYVRFAVTAVGSDGRTSRPSQASEWVEVAGSAPGA